MNLRINSWLLATVVLISSLPCQTTVANPVTVRPPQLHATTDWGIQPSFVMDTICLLNILTGDEFYTNYYKADYVRFEPQLTPAARTALTNLKRKIKDEKKNIISAFLALYFSATDDRTRDDMLRTLEHIDDAHSAAAKLVLESIALA